MTNMVSDAGSTMTTVAMCAAKSRAPAAAAGHYSQLKVSTGIPLHTCIFVTNWAHSMGP